MKEVSLLRESGKAHLFQTDEVRAEAAWFVECLLGLHKALG